MAFVTGRSGHYRLEELALVIHLALYALQCHIYFEWVRSKQNWADGISHDGASDPWLNRHGFFVFHAAMWPFWRRMPLLAVVAVFAFLSKDAPMHCQFGLVGILWEFV